MYIIQSKLYSMDNVINDSRLITIGGITNNLNLGLV